MPVKYTKAEKADLEAKALGVSKPRSAITLVPVQKQDGDVVKSNEVEFEDSFENFYTDDGQQPAVLRPPFNLHKLAWVIQNNNALNQLITAMEVNIDGTGFVIESQDPEEVSDEDQEVIDGVEDFFKEVWPGTSFVTVRRQMRRDQESIGVAYLEVIRNIAGEIVFLKRLDAKHMRLIALDEEVPVTVTVDRFGETMEVTLLRRERRYAQFVHGSNAHATRATGPTFGTGNVSAARNDQRNRALDNSRQDPNEIGGLAGVEGHIVYFRDYGSSRHLNKFTGHWETEANQVPVADRATEVLMFGVNEDVHTPYYVPRWINQTPSVLGSRLAEELNLDFFHSGGLPPALILVQGGELTAEVKKNLQAYLSGRGSSYHRAAVVEVLSSEGTVDRPGSVKIDVERFGAERASDSMFENYIATSERRTRGSFRLPPIFVGKTEDYSFATAFASYTVAEAQVFSPERREFDERVNTTIMKELAPGFRMRSLGLSLKDVKNQLRGIQLAIGTQGASLGSILEQINEITDLNLLERENIEDIQDVDEEDTEGNADEEVIPEDDDALAGSPVQRAHHTDGEKDKKPGKDDDKAGREGGKSRGRCPAGTRWDPKTERCVREAPREAKGKETREADPLDLLLLANRWARYMNGGDVSAEEVSEMNAEIKALEKDDRRTFDSYLAAVTFGDAATHDPEGVVDLCSVAADLWAQKMEHDDECEHCDHDHD